MAKMGQGLASGVYSQPKEIEDEDDKQKLYS